jgi:hypothetical protein
MTTMDIGGKPHEAQAVVEHAKKARQWFAFIAGLSLVNSVLALVGTEWGFAIGLGVTQIVDVFVAVAREEAGAAGATAFTVVGFVVNLFIIGLVMLVWWLAGRGSTTAYLVGMICYALDALLFVWVRDWIGVGLHAFFLYGMWGGYQFMREWPRARQLLSQTATGTHTPSPTAPAP